MFVNITGNTTLGMITVSIEILKGTSSLVKFPPQGLVYKNVNIWVGSSGFATPKNIKDAFIKFKIDNEWMKANGVSAGDIVLMKWDGNSWISLKTTVVSKDGTNSIFEGWTNSFSPFAIVAKTAGVAQPTVTTPATPSGTPQVTATGKPEPIGKESGITSWIIGLIILVIIGAGAYYFMVVKKKE
jgi:PGF-pre-PGF domain-containing protein